MSKNKLSNPKKQSLQQTLYLEASYSGPLPPADLLAQYETIMPGAAKILFDTFQTESNHRRSIETKTIDSEIRNSTLGLLFGFIAAITIATFGFICILKGYEIGGSILSGGTIAGTASVFVFRKIQKPTKSEG